MTHPTPSLSDRCMKSAGALESVVRPEDWEPGCGSVVGEGLRIAMMRLLHLRTAAIAGACLIAGIAIGFVIPRHAQVAPFTHGIQDSLADANPRPIGRNVYSPVVLGDAYVRGKHFELVELLEHQCRTTGENCQLAIAARRAVNRPR
jgi:hypothetical protein